MKGLINNGNTCYMNAALQCLSHIPELRNYFLTGSHKDELKKNMSESGLIIEYENLLYKMCQSREEPVINPINFIHNFILVCREKNNYFSGFQQNDVDDFINIFMDFVHNSISRKINVKITGKIINPIDKIAYDAALSWERFFNKIT